MQQSSRRPPSYPSPTYVQPTTQPAAAAPQRSPRTHAAAPPKLAAAPTQFGAASRDVVVRPLGLQILSVAGILHASLTLMAIVVILVMAVGGDARVAEVNRTIKQNMGLWTWTLFATLTAFVLGFVLLYNAIGTLSLAPWSQRATKVWSTVWLALGAVALIINLGWIYPMLKDASPERFSFARLLLVTWAHIAAGIIWPAVVLFYMNTRHVKQAYARLARGAAML